MGVVKMDVSLKINNDLLLVAFFMKENAWKNVNQTNFHRVLYFSAVLAPIYLFDEKWGYDFSNTIYGPSNIIITEQLRELSVKGFLEIEKITVLTNRTEELYCITDEGIGFCKTVLFCLKNKKKRVAWFKIIVKLLSLYGNDFMSKLIKEEPNIHNQSLENQKSKLFIDNSENNLSKQFFEFLKKQTDETLDSKNMKNEDYLLLFFDILYRKYKEGN